MFAELAVQLEAIVQYDGVQVQGWVLLVQQKF